MMRHCACMFIISHSLNNWLSFVVLHLIDPLLLHHLQLIWLAFVRYWVTALSVAGSCLSPLSISMSTTTRSSQPSPLGVQRNRTLLLLSESISYLVWSLILLSSSSIFLTTLLLLPTQSDAIAPSQYMSATPLADLGWRPNDERFFFPSDCFDSTNRTVGFSSPPPSILSLAPACTSCCSSFCSSWV
jgi:hypothetical protein